MESGVGHLVTSGERFTFIDLFAGIGGFRIALEALGGECTFSSEWDADAQKTYLHNFGERPHGDITDPVVKSAIPRRVDLLCGGFPCQAFSIAGKQRGFDDTRGMLFFDIAEIARVHRPRALLLENVKNLLHHDGGHTYRTIVSTLESIGYHVTSRVLCATTHANIPQSRERLFIVALDPAQVPCWREFRFPAPVPLTSTIHDCIAEQTATPAHYYSSRRMARYEEMAQGVVSGDSIYQWRRHYVRENKHGVCPTLTANMGTGGHNVPLVRTPRGIRQLTPRECLNFQGFPAWYGFPDSISRSAQYKQAGNSVVVPLVQRVGYEIVRLFP